MDSFGTTVFCVTVISGRTGGGRAVETSTTGDMDSGSAASSKGPGGCGMARVSIGSGPITVSAVLEKVHAAVINKVQVATVIRKTTPSFRWEKEWLW